MTGRASWAIATDLMVSDAPPTAAPEWVKIFPLGEWDHPADGRWVIDRDFAEQVVANHRARVAGIDIALDLHHQNTGAPGWIVDLEAREDGVWAQVRWTPLGERLVTSGEYRYVSPEWYWDYVRASDGKHFANVLTGLALTNDPFFRELPALVSLAENPRIVGASGAPGGNSDMPNNADANGTNAPMVGDNGMGTAGAQGGAPNPPSGASTAGQGAQSGPGSLAGAPPPHAETTPDMMAHHQAMQRSQAESWQRMQAQIAEQQATIQAMQRREERMQIAARLREMPHPDRPGSYMAPALAERLAGVLAQYSDQRPAAAQGQAPEEVRSPREDVLELVMALSRPWPVRGEIGLASTPTAGAGMTYEQKAEELDKLATARAAASNGTLDYAGAVKACLAERPDLLPTL